jgi:hypothetical protein
MRLAFLLLVLLSLAGCGSAPAPESPWISTADIPADLLAGAQKKLPNVKFETARKIQKKGKDVFEIRGKQPNGKVREVEITADGEIIEVE